MNIALMSHDHKKELMVQFCTAYCGVLSKHTVCATNTTGRMVAEATGLPVNLFLYFYICLIHGKNARKIVVVPHIGINKILVVYKGEIIHSSFARGIDYPRASFYCFCYGCFSRSIVAKEIIDVSWGNGSAGAFICGVIESNPYNFTG